MPSLAHYHFTAPMALDENLTSETCLTAVKENGLAVEHVKTQTADIGLESVGQNLALAYVSNDEDRRYISSLGIKYNEHQTWKQSVANAAKHFFSSGSK